MAHKLILRASKEYREKCGEEPGKTSETSYPIEPKEEPALTEILAVQGDAEPAPIEKRFPWEIAFRAVEITILLYLAAR